MARLRYTAAARDDLSDVACYILQQSGSRDAARRFTAYLRQRCVDLAAPPFPLGRPRPELRPDLRSVAVGNYVIFFRYVGDVLDVIEGHRDIEAHFK